MGRGWILARRLCIEKLNTFDQDRLYAEETKQGRMLGANEIIRMFYGKLKWLKDKAMPENAGDLFYNDMIPCSPKIIIEVQNEDKKIEQKNIGGTQILQYFDSGNIINVLHLWDRQMDLAHINLWDKAVFKKGKDLTKEVYE